VRAMSKSVYRLQSRRFLKFILNRTMSELDENVLRKSTVVFSPHPDDETLGCGGTIIKKKRMDTDVTIVFTTDGRTSHRHLISEDKMKSIRKKEALEASRVLGMKEKDLIFLEFRSGKLFENWKSAIFKVVDILTNRKPEEIFIPYYREPSRWGQGDHLATNRLVVSALKIFDKKIIVNEYPIGFWCNWPWAEEAYTLLSKLGVLKNSIFSNFNMLRDFRYFVYVEDFLETKRTALDQHKSQMTRFMPDPRWQTLADVSNGKFLECFFQEREIFHRYTL